jgi:long-chain acyl-CoA synthetase
VWVKVSVNPMDYLSLPQRLLEAFDKFRSPRAVLYRTTTGWKEIGTAEMLRRIAGLSQALAGLGVKSGERVALFAPNCPEWHIADFAISGLGAVVVPIYFKEAPERIGYIVQDSGARVAFAAGEEQVKQLLASRSRAPGLECLILSGAPAGLDGNVLRYETLIADAKEASVAEYRRRAAEVKPEQLATLIYTSGTTGEPKGVMLTHRNISSIATLGVKIDDYRAGDTALSFLPLAHVYERLLDYGYFFRGIVVAYVARIEDVAQALLEVHPGFAALVPRVLEKIYANLMQRGQESAGWKRGVFRWAMRVAAEAGPWRAFGRPVPLRVKLEWLVADRLVYSKIRDGLGGKFRRCVTGGGPLAPELIEFFWSVGIDVYQGYGLTESTAIVSTNKPGANKVGTVGRPVEGVEARIAADGEVEVRGCGIMQGYFNKPEATREALTEDGWLRTGDIGAIDADGYLSITDRKKDLLKTAGGKYVAPQPIENSLKTSPYILNVAVVGDQRKFVSALIVPNFENVGAEAKRAGIAFATPAELAAHPWTHSLVEKEVERLTKECAQYEKIKRFALLDRDFTVDGGELTYTMKLKRRVIEKTYRETIENLYADVAEPRPRSLN